MVLKALAWIATSWGSSLPLTAKGAKWSRTGSTYTSKQNVREPLHRVPAGAEQRNRVPTTPMANFALTANPSLCHPQAQGFMAIRRVITQKWITCFGSPQNQHSQGSSTQLTLGCTVTSALLRRNQREAKPAITSKLACIAVEPGRS